MLNIALLPAAALLAAGLAAVQGGPPRPDRDAAVSRAEVIERVDQRFARLDANNDGRFTAEEGRAMRERRREEMAGRIFDRIDADRNGSISRDEMNRAREQRQARRGERMASGRGMRALRMMRGQRMAMAFGPDGAVTREEFRQRALERFDRADADRNGTVTAEERRAARQQRRMRMRGGPGGPPPPPQD